MRIILCIFATILLAACATSGPHPLLQHDYTKMTDVGILRYYYDLGEAIDECNGSKQGDTTVSVGGGAGSGGSIFGVALGQQVGDGCDAAPLRDRRTDVRLEMRKRGINP